MQPSRGSSPFSSQRMRLLQSLMSEKKLIDDTQSSVIQPQPRPAYLPLSFAQQRLWFMYQLLPESSLYNTPVARYLLGKLDIALLRRCLDEIVCRHEILRTSFSVVEEVPVQVIHPCVPVELPVIDLSNLHEKEVQQQISEQVMQPFDLEAGPALRAQLFLLKNDEYILLLTIHHILFDGWSSRVLFEEFSALYAAFLAGQPSPLATLSIQYADYTLWQRQHLHAAASHALRAYWQARLADAPLLLTLPTDHPRPPIPSGRGASLAFQLPATLSQRLLQLSQQEGVTLFMTLLAAWQVVLSRHSGQEDLLLGTPIANRGHPDLEGLIGCFINTLVLRTSLEGRPSFRQLLSRVKETCLEAYAHQDLPFEHLVETLRPERSLSFNPLFQVLIAFQNTPKGQLALPGVSLRPLSIEQPTARFDLSLTLMQDGEGNITGSLEYSLDLFEALTISRLLEHFQVVLQRVVVDIEQPLDRLPLLSETERQHVLMAGKPDVQDLPESECCIHDLFEEQARQRPEVVALVCEEQMLTYGALDARASQLGRQLREWGVGPEVLVAVCLERSLELVIGLLGVLKAGGAYVPLDPAAPTERLVFMLQDAQVALLLTRDRLKEKFSAVQVPLYDLDTDQDQLNQQLPITAQSQVQPGNLAYVIYTSGSTGVPKGVMVEHRQVIRLFLSTQERFAFNSADVWTLFHSYAFDFSVWELWGALLYGGQLVIVPYWISRAPDAFAALLKRQQVTVLNQTPSAFRQLMRSEEDIADDQALQLRLVIFGGEMLDPQSLRPWFQRHGDRQPQLVNMYGITETTVHVTWQMLTQQMADAESGSCIGRPLPDLHVYILDKAFELVPVGVAGEIYVGGAGVSRGYLGHPELTAERFVPHPFSSLPGARLYKTGDVARSLLDDRLEFLGRNDQQVKLRGFRIELGEIESALMQHPAIQQAVVTLQEARGGEKRLVAYLVPSAVPLMVEDVRHYLQNHLPEYMLPGVFTWLQTLPLTVNGKINYAALPSPDFMRPELTVAYTAPRTQVEKRLANIWAQVLGVKQVGVHDSFFALGGDSLKSVQVLALAKEQGIHYSLQQQFRHQTIYELGLALQSSSANGLEVPSSSKPFGLLSPADYQALPQGLEDAYPLARLQAGMFFHSEYSPDAAIYHNIISLRIQARFSDKALREALRLAIARHPVLRTSFEPGAFSEPLQFVQRPECISLPLTISDLSTHSTGEQQEALTAFWEKEQLRAFDWQHAPLFRVQVHLLDENTFQITYTEHHAILDGWSVASLLTELLHSYSLLLENLPVSPRPFYTTFRDFVALERETIIADAARRYWAEQMDEGVITRLPYRRSSEQASNAHPDRTLSLPVPAESLRGIEQAAALAAVPLKSVLLAAHLYVLRCLSGQNDIITGLVCNGRLEVRDSEHILGLFLNSVPLRIAFERGTWIDLARRVFQLEQELLPFRRYPLAEIQRLAGGQELFDVLFNFVHFHVYDQMRNLPNLQVLDMREFARSNFALVANFSVRSSASLRLTLECNAVELPDAQLQTIGRYYLNTLAAIANDPYQPYERYSPLTRAERQYLLVECNQTQKALPEQPCCIQQMFEKQVQRIPDAVALVYEDLHLGYAELNEQANRLAHFLMRMGAGSEKLIGVCLERSPDLVIGLLGILKAGGTYVPLDPGYPDERLTHIVRTTPIEVIVTRRQLEGRFSEHDVQLVCLENVQAPMATNCGGNPALRIEPGQLAYMLYTSGSTGQPRGVMVEHGNVTNYLNWVVNEFFTETMLPLPVVTSLSFDASLKQLFAPLLCGSAVWLLSDEVLADPLSILRALSGRNRVALNCVPSLWRILLDQFQANPTLKASVRIGALLLGGEALSGDLVERTLEILPDVPIYNLYGPTEATANASLARIGASEDVSIGKPIANTQLYVLDAAMELTPMGVAGELYIGGMGVTRGYFHLPHLTAAQFVPHPFSTIEGARLYRTGDSVRYRPDGTLEFLGRRDQQVKFHGFRIELAEIEAVLAWHPAVRECVVLLREDTPGDQRLTAYVVERLPHELGALVLRSYIQKQLPEFMVPTNFVFIEALPLTANGKVNRRALPAPDAGAADLESIFVMPRTPVEEILCDLWGQLLRIQQIGIHDNFFALGGHSLLAMQIVSRIRALFQIEIPLRAFFEAPTIASLAERIEKMFNPTQYQPLPPLIPVSRTHRSLPLSFAQQRLWFLHQVGQDIYHIPLALLLAGSLNVSILQRSLEEIIRRHEILRTTFEVLDGEIIQVVALPGEGSFPFIDISHLAEKEAYIRILLHEGTMLPFDLTQGPLLRMYLLRLDASTHILLLAIHHILFDGWSSGVLFKELSALYTAFLAEQPSPLATLPIQYADYSLWQRQHLHAAASHALRAYWQARLADAPLLFTLPTDHPRPSIPSGRGASLAFQLSATLSQRLLQLSQQEGVTLFMTLLAAWEVVLSRHSGQEDLLLGTPIANRGHPDLEGLIGCFVNTLVLRTSLEGRPSFRQLLSRVKETCLEAYAHQDLPFEHLVEALRPERSLSFNPLFQVLIAFQNMPKGQLALPGVSLRPLSIEQPTARFDLSLTLTQDGEGNIIGSLEYSLDLFEALTISRLLEHFQVVLQGVVVDIEQPLDRLPLLSEAERQHVLAAGNPDAWDLPESPCCIHELFEEQARQRPEAVALVCEEQVLTYGELDARASQLGRHLREWGVGPEVLVAVCLERSLELAIGLLGVLKTGGAYVPLDPAAPTERLAFMLQDTQAPILITKQHLIDRFDGAGIQMICLDADAAIFVQQSNIPLTPAIQRGNLAYVIYTSGSTGQPKGVQIAHGGLLNLVLWYHDTFTVTPEDRATQIASPAFDAAGWELWPALTAGARIYIPAEETRVNIPVLRDWLIRQSITMTFLPPVLAEQIMAMEFPQTSTLRILLTGADTLQHYPPPTIPYALFNTYGPTEATVVMIAGRIFPTEHPDGLPPIGRPIYNMQNYILDPSLQPVPIGTPGELYIGGIGLARGYLNRPELTAERFVPHPFSSLPGARLYKTGDVARSLLDDRLEFLGRNDQQVKLRGFRIELGEIENVLMQHPAVQLTIVTLQEVRSGEKRLVAYLVPSALPLMLEDVRQFLKERLPEYMLPAHYIQMDALPLTANGKVNRKGLPLLNESETKRDEAYRAPRDSIELQLTHIWENLLGIKSISVRDAFFDLGGHSLLAVRLMAEIQQTFGQDLPLATLFQRATIESLSQLLRERREDRARSALVSMQPGGERTPLFLFHPIGGEVLCYLELVRHFDPDRPVYGLQSIGPNDHLLDESLEQMSARYLEEIRSVSSHGPYMLAGWSLGGVIAFEVAQQLLKQGEEIASLILIDSLAPASIVDIDELQLVMNFGHDLLHLETLVENLDLTVSVQREQTLSVHTYLELLQERAQQAGLLPPGADTDYLQRLWHTFRHNYRLGCHYRPQRYPHSIILLRAWETAERHMTDPTLGWEHLTAQNVEVLTLPGNHYTMMNPPEVIALAHALQECLDAASKES